MVSVKIEIAAQDGRLMVLQHEEDSIVMGNHFKFFPRDKLHFGVCVLSVCLI